MPRKPTTAERKADLAAETKAQKFARLGNARYKRAVSLIRSLGKLGTSAYERDPAKVEALGEVLHAEIDAAIAKLMPREGKASAVDSIPDAL
jgi:hypothetical protein